MVFHYLYNTGVSLSLTIVSILVVVAYSYWKRLRNNHYWKLRNVAADDPLPVLGNFLGFIKGKSLFQLDDDLYQRHGRIFGAYVGPSPMLFVAEPELIRKILVKDFHAFKDRRQVQTSNKVVGNFVNVLEGEDWHRVRAVVTPAFSTGKLKKMIELILDCGESTRKNFQKHADSGHFVDCKLLFGGYTLDVIARAAFGTKLNSHEDPDNIFVQKAKKLFSRGLNWKVIVFFISPKLCKLLGLNVYDDDVTGFFANLSRSIVERRKKNNEVRDDFLNNLIEAQENKTDQDEISQKDGEDENEPYFKSFQRNKTISEDELVAQCVILFLAGYDTTATALSLATYNLAQNPECQAKLIQEVDAVWKKHNVIDAESLRDMKYADAVISETLRLYPPAGRLERRALEDYELGDTGIVIPKDMIVAIPIYPMQRDPEFFPNPESFNPDRFLPENKDQIQPYTYMPFGSGPRNCLGMRMALMEIKLALLLIFRDFTFDVCSKTKIPLEVTTGSGLYSPKEVTLKVTRRNK